MELAGTYLLCTFRSALRSVCGFDPDGSALMSRVRDKDSSRHALEGRNVAPFVSERQLMVLKTKPHTHRFSARSASSVWSSVFFSLESSVPPSCCAIFCQFRRMKSAWGWKLSSSSFSCSSALLCSMWS